MLDRRCALALAAAAAGVSLILYLAQRGPAKLLTKERKKAKILEVVQISPDTKRFRLSTGGSSTRLGLPVGKHLVLYAPNPSTRAAAGQWNGREDKEASKSEIERKYTPITGDSTPGYVDLVVKIYRPGKVKMPDGKEADWCDGGKMSLYLDSKKAGDLLEINGPFGLNEYEGRGTFRVMSRTVSVKHVAMIAGGTGVTPMLQVVTASLLDPEDTTEFSLIYGNKTENDILCKDLLDAAVARSKGRFQVHYTLDFPPADWKHRKGFVTQDMIKACLPAPSAEPLVLMCGPPPMIEFACKKNLEALGYAKTSWVMF
eukprot:TRINITY_DN7297_c0_g1_i1.p1 TRINITY_DN7297_c0_g1~~TRINITY_DN7297_c0_g1_i1.p1  ORF type:complete len:315 (-),score=89.14 TRINITY_DN7297_c0_g1_i1:268-1212(-)